MKKLLLTLLCLITFGFTNGQSNKEIANVYLKRAKAAIETDVDFPRALIHLNKALTRLDTITDKNIASLASTNPTCKQSVASMPEPTAATPK